MKLARLFLVLALPGALTSLSRLNAEGPGFKNLVEVAHPTDPGFKDKLMAILGTRDSSALAPLLGHTLIVTNKSGHAITSFLLTETRKNGAGDIGYSVFRNGRAATPASKTSSIASGASRIVTSEPAVNGLVAQAERTEEESHKLAQLSRELPNALDSAGLTVVSVDLDSVVLDDGLVLGPDRYGVVEELAEEIRALESMSQLADTLGTAASRSRSRSSTLPSTGRFPP